MLVTIIAIVVVVCYCLGYIHGRYFSRRDT